MDGDRSSALYQVRWRMRRPKRILPTALCLVRIPIPRRRLQRRRNSMKIDPGVIRNWALAAIAVASVFGGMLAYGKKVVAQEARKEAAAQMEPATKELGREEEAKIEMA